MFSHYKQLSFPLLLIGCLLIQVATFAQQSVNAGANTQTLPDGSSISGTFGQIFIHQTTLSSLIISEGIHQPLETENPLPVTLLYFKATLTPEQYVMTQWSTASEVNHAYFTIERSANGKDFDTLHKLNSSGDQPITKTYDYVDMTPLEGTSYYRLKQTDHDGTFTYSPMVAIQSGITTSQVTIYPNPTTEYLIIRLDQTVVSPSTYTLFSTTGTLIQSGQLSEHVSQLLLEHLSPSTYVLTVQNGQQRKSFRIVKQ